jgi:hypothetical protein
MSESAFNFKNAPSSNMGRQFLAFGGLKKAFGNKSSGGISARDQSKLMEQQTSHNIETALNKHVLGEMAADAAHKRAMSQTNQAHQLSQNAANAQHERDTAASTNLIDHFERIGGSGQFNNLSIGSKGVSGTFNTSNKTSSGDANLE